MYFFWKKRRARGIRLLVCRKNYVAIVFVETRVAKQCRCLLLPVIRGGRLGIQSPFVFEEAGRYHRIRVHWIYVGIW